MGMMQPPDNPPVETKIVSGAALQLYDFAHTLIPGKRYQIVAKIINDNVGTATVSLRLNGAPAVGDTQTFHANATTLTGARTTDTVMGVMATLQPGTLTIDIPSIVQDEPRNFEAVMAEPISGVPQYRMRETTIYPTTPAIGVALTSVGLGMDVASALGLTTELALYELS